MFPTSTPLLYSIQVIAVLLAVVATLFFTANPLALMGIVFMWQSPPTVTPDPKQIEAGAPGSDDKETVGEEEASSRIGFVQ